MERLIEWMEEHLDELRGKQITWQKDAKEQLFPNDSHIMIRKLTDKVANMKRAWKEARAMQDQSGWGLQPDDNETSINDRLKRKCPFYWRLDAIWGSRPNVTVVDRMESMSVKASQKDSQSQVQRLSQIPSLPEQASSYAEEADDVEEGSEIVQLDPPASPQLSDDDTEFEWPASPMDCGTLWAL